MKRKILVFTLLVSGLLITAEKYFAQNASAGMDVIKITSEILKEERNILVKLPDEYAILPEDGFPVIYMLDGDYKNPQMMSTVVDHLASNFQMSPAILVSIPNTSRNRDLTPTPDDEVRGSGGGDKFLDFLGQEVFPVIEKKYRTRPYRIFAGHSFGGLTVVYTMLTRPEMFNAYLAASPDLAWDNNLMIRRAAKSLAKPEMENRILFVSLGDEPALVKEYNLFKNQITLAKPKNLIYEFKQIPNENHASAIMLEYYYGLKKIYDDWSPIPKTFPLPKTWLSEMEAHFKKLSAKYGYEIRIPETILNGIGYGLLYQEKRTGDALVAFKKNVELYPNSPNVYDSLGEAYETKGDLPAAKDNYEKAYKLAEEKGDLQFSKNAKANYERIAAQIK